MPKSVKFHESDSTFRLPNFLFFMSATTRLLLLAALPALVAGWLVLYISNVETGIWAIQAVATLLMISFAYLGDSLPRDLGKGRFPLVCVVVAAAVCVLPTSENGPNRWVNLGPVRFYVAAIVLPFALALSGGLFQRKSKAGMAALGFIGPVLVFQPDFSQLLAFSTGLLLILFNSSVSAMVRLAFAVLLGAACGVAFAQPDPLKPVPYVEGVFELAFRHSIFVGVAIVSGAVAFLGLLAGSLRSINPGFLGIPAYYAVLYGCSVAGLTPAPLIGFGAGPLLGFGLLVATVAVAMDSGQDQWTVDN